MHYFDILANIINLYHAGLYMINPNQLRDAVDAWATDKVSQ